MYAIDSSGRRVTDTNAFGKGGLDIFAGLGVVNVFTVGGQTISISDAATVGLAIIGAASQSANLQEWQDNAGANLSVISSIGTASHFATDAGTTSVTAALQLAHQSSGTPDVGFGVSTVFYLDSTTTELREGALIEVLWATATDASRKARIVVSVYDTAVRECLRFDTDGSGANASFFGAGDYESGRGVIFVTNAGAAPSANPTGGGILYSTGGAGTWRGSGGTTTTFGPAGPHCGACGADFWRTCYVNERWGAELRECGWCGKVYRRGPQTFFHLLTAEQQAELLPG